MFPSPSINHSLKTTNWAPNVGGGGCCKNKTYSPLVVFLWINSTPTDHSFASPIPAHLGLVEASAPSAGERNQQRAEGAQRVVGAEGRVSVRLQEALGLLKQTAETHGAVLLLHGKPARAAISRGSTKWARFCEATLRFFGRNQRRPTPSLGSQLDASLHAPRTAAHASGP